MRRSACVISAVACVLAMANGAHAAKLWNYASEGAMQPRHAIVGDGDATADRPIAHQMDGDAVTANSPNNPLALDSRDQQVKQRLQVYLTRELLEHFDLFVYVSKASEGPWAQRMYVFQKQPDESLYLLYDWPVSTGRESTEPNPAGTEVPPATPAGFYELDPERFYSQYPRPSGRSRCPTPCSSNGSITGCRLGLPSTAPPTRPWRSSAPAPAPAASGWRRTTPRRCSPSSMTATRAISRKWPTIRPARPF